MFGCEWNDEEAVDVLRRWVQILREMLAYVSYFLARTTIDQQTRLVATIWQELYQGLSHTLQADNIRMRDYAERNGAPLYNAPTHYGVRSPVPIGTEPAECHICMNREPTVALEPCGHCFCNICIGGMGDCPICRRRIEKYLNIYL